MKNHVITLGKPIKYQLKRIKKKIGYILRHYFHFPLLDFMIRSDRNTILALTESDYGGLGVFRLLQNNTRISSILALDLAIVDMALKRNIPFEICEDYLNEDELNEICHRFNYYSSHCLDNIKEVTVDGINYAKLEETHFRYIFNELLFSKSLIEKILSHKKTIITIKERCNRFYESCNSDRFYRAASVFNSNKIRYIIGSADPQWELYQGDWDRDINIQNKIAIVCMDYDIERHREIIHKLNIQFPNRICILSLGKYTGTFNEVPIYSTPLYRNSVNDGAFLPILAHNKDEYIVDEALFPYFFQLLTHFCQWKWPNMRQAFLRFKELFLAQRPLCVIGAFGYDAESQIPIIAAKQANIATYAWEGALMQGNFPHYFADTIFVSSEKMRQVIESQSRQRTIAVNNYADLSLLYKNIEEPVWETSKSFKILVLPGICKFNGSPGVLNNLRKIGQQISELLSIPDTLKGKIDIRFKAHPGYHNSTHYTAKNDDSSSHFFSSKLNLLSLLDIADCCVLLGEYGCSVMHASMRVPTFFIDTNFNPERQYCSLMKQFPHYYTQISQIWHEIDHLIHEPEYKKLYLERQKCWMPYDASYPTITEALRTDLNL